MSDYYIPPKEVAKRLGVSASGLRRLATLYEGLYGPLPRAIPSDASSSRVWPAEAVERLDAARSLIASGRAKSIQDALTALETGDTGQSEGLAAMPTQAVLQGEALAILIEELRGMRRELAELRADNQIMRKQIEAPRAHRVSIIPIDPYRVQLEQRNQELEAELERRRLKAEGAPEPRPWWKRWGKR